MSPREFDSFAVVAAEHETKIGAHLDRPGICDLADEMQTRHLLYGAADATYALERTLRALAGRNIPADAATGFRNAVAKLQRTTGELLDTISAGASAGSTNHQPEKKNAAH